MVKNEKRKLLGRLVVFFLGPRIIDFDTYLPTALEIATRFPETDVRFVTFSPGLLNTIQTNPTLAKAVDDTGHLHMLGGHGARSFPTRQWRRGWNLLRLLGLILIARRPVLISTRPFSDLPYSLFYIAARLKGGLSVVLAKTRSPDSVHSIVWQNREKPKSQGRSIAARMFGRDADLAVDYHDRQSENFDLALELGSARGVSRERIGFPHLLPAWRQLIEAEIAAASERFRGRPVFAMLAAKPDSAVNLREPSSIALAFFSTLEVVFDTYPNAYVLVRPHPLAVDSDYVQEALRRHEGQIELSRLHPEVLIALAKRTIVNNPTNVIFSCFPGRFIDVSDYAEKHYEERGPVSLAHGLGPLHIGPRWPDFEKRLKKALADDGVFDDPTLDFERTRLLEENPTDLSPFISAIRLA
jgi:hypothetical protein